MDILPDVYKEVCSEISAVERLEMLPLNARVKLNGETIFTCDLCDKKYVRKMAMKKHMQTKHGQNNVVNDVQPPAKQISFVPMPLSPLPTAINVMNISLSGGENNGDGLDDIEISLEENIPLVLEEIGPQWIQNNWQCGECGKTYEDEGELVVHIETHKENQPDNDH